MDIPLHKVYWNQHERAAIKRVFSFKTNGKFNAFKIPLINQAKKLLGVKYVIPVSSCTTAVEVALQALNISNGDEVICPSFEFSSIPAVIIKLGAIPVFADIEASSFNVDPKSIEACITPKTKAVIIVHYAGRGAELSKIKAICKSYSIPLIEDAAHALGALYKGRQLGTFGDFGCFSFNETKNLTGEKGGLLVGNQPSLMRKAEVIAEYGTNKLAYLRKEIKLYEWVGAGSNYSLTDICAAIISEQLKKTGAITKQRNNVARKIHQQLSPYHPKLLTLPQLHVKNQLSNWHIFPVLVDKRKRPQILASLNKKGIHAAFHLLPLHLSQYAKKYLHYKKGDLPVTEHVSTSLIRLPIFPQMTDKEIKWMTQEIGKTVQWLT